MDIEKEIENLRERIKKLENNKNTFILDSRASEDDIIGKSYRFHKNAIDEFNKTIAKKNLKIYSVQDLLSQALWEFAERYNDLE